MRVFSQKAVLEVFAAIFVNLSSGWMGIILISPGLFELTKGQFSIILLKNVPFAIVGLLIVLALTERRESYEYIHRKFLYQRFRFLCASHDRCSLAGNLYV